MAKPKTATVSKTDLMRLLKQIGRMPSKRHEELQKKVQQADERYDRYCNQNKTYRWLRSEAQAARSAAHRCYLRDQANRASAINRARNEIMLHGPTPAVVKAVEKLLKKYGGL